MSDLILTNNNARSPLYLLSNDHAAVQSFFEHCRGQRPDGWGDDARQKLGDGCSWPKCFEKAMAIREIVAKEFEREARNMIQYDTDFIR